MSAEQKTIDTLDEAIKEINALANLPKTINIEVRRGHKRKPTDIAPYPFTYGEIPHLLNPHDGDPWDVALMPGAKLTNNLQAVGYIPSKKTPGNYKILLGNNGKTTSEAKTLLKDGLEPLDKWFGSPKYFKTADETGNKTLLQKKASILESPGEFTKRANLQALIAALAASPVLGAASGLYNAKASAPLEATLGGAAGGIAGGVAGAGLGSVGTLLLQLIANRQINPKALASAATLAGLLGAIGGGSVGARMGQSATGASQESLLASILEEMRAGRAPEPPSRFDLLR